MIIDAHQHFWQLDRGDYGWLKPQLSALYRDFLPNDLAPNLTRNQIAGTVLVQAAPTIAETEFMLELADGNDFIKGVVGWIDFEAPTAANDIARLAEHPKLVGMRPMIQDIADDDWMLGDPLTQAFEALIKHNLCFDALVLPHHLPRLRRLLERHPHLRTVIDHGAKPEIATSAFGSWAQGISDIARQTNAFCKLSGLLTEAPEHWRRSDIAPYIEHIIAEFGCDRLIWGSDWPVLTLAADYDIWRNLAQTFITDEAERRAVFGGNAVAFYQLNAD
ncbi:MAG: amidohydrolase family protein [Pseudoruegeria sp.]